jgi:hypothetical protein
MLLPHKYLNLELSVISITAVILSVFKAENFIKYDDLLKKLIDLKGEEVKEVFLPSLSFLYLIGKLKYHKSIDSIEYIK